LIMSSIAKLGFDIKDVRVLLNSEPHPDHGGGLTVLQQASGAQLWASAASADSLAAGGDDPDVILPLRALIWIGVLGYPPPRVDHRFRDGDTIRVGPIALTAHITAGHTRGCTSWSFPVRDGDRVLNVVSVCDPGVLATSRYPEQDADRGAACASCGVSPLTSGSRTMRERGAGIASSSQAPPRRTRSTRSSTPRATALSSMPPKRNYAKGGCTSSTTLPVVEVFFAGTGLSERVFRRERGICRHCGIRRGAPGARTFRTGTDAAVVAAIQESTAETLW